MPNPTKTNSEQGGEWEEKLKELIERVRSGEKDDVCIYNFIRQQQSLLLDKVKEIVSGNYKGAFIDNAGFECWYVDDLLQSLDSLIDKK